MLRHGASAANLALYGDDESVWPAGPLPGFAVNYQIDVLVQRIRRPFWHSSSPDRPAPRITKSGAVGLPYAIGHLGGRDCATAAARVVQIPGHLVSRCRSRVAFVSEMYPDIETKCLTASFPEWIASRTIVTPCNRDVDFINQLVLDRLPGEAVTYYSIDSCRDGNAELDFAPEVLNTLTLPGLPPHALRLKKNAIVMLIRNLDASSGLCNGTRLQVLRLGSAGVYAKIVSKNPFFGRCVCIPRINHTQSKSSFPFQVVRRNLPLRLAFCTTINKAQGATYEMCGVYLPRPVFTHGQLYVAFSRVRAAHCLKVYGETSAKQYRCPDTDIFLTMNIVYPLAL